MKFLGSEDVAPAVVGDKIQGTRFPSIPVLDLADRRFAFQCHRAC